MHIIKTSLYCSRAALLAGLVLASATASAASQCKGVQQDACLTMAACSWVNGYERKDGRSVSGHCKTKARRKSDGQAALGTGKLSHAR